MTTVEWISFFLFIAIALTWFAIAMLGTLGVLLTRPIARHDPDPDPPEVTIVIAARDEADRIGTTIDHLLAITSPQIRIVIVDDRSTDATASIVERMADLDPRLRLIRIDELPDGWLGKPYALHLGTQGITTEWILFSDADTWISEDTLARALSAARQSARPIDHVAVLPGYEACSILGVAGTLSLYIHFLIRCGVTNVGLPFLPVGVGAFNLVRTQSYRAIGGHEALRFEVVDDVKLAILLQREGRNAGRGHALILSGPEAVRIDWKADISTLVGLIEKNFFAMARFSPIRAALLISAGASALVGAVLGLVVALLPDLAIPLRIAALLSGLTWLSTGLPMAAVTHQFRWPWLGGLISPLMAWVAPLALSRSARRTMRDGGVTWRGRLYPIAELRERQVW